MRDCDKNKEPYPKYWCVNSLYGWAKSQMLPVNSFKWIQEIVLYNEEFIRSYNEESDEGCFFKIDVKYSQMLR